MDLTLYIYPPASFCHTVLIALYETGTAFETQIIDFADPGSATADMERWLVGKIPVLHDSLSGRTIPEPRFIIEYLQAHDPGRLMLLPNDPDLLLQLRLWDRIYDLSVSQSMQRIVIGRIRPAEAKDPYGVEEARSILVQASAMIEAEMAGQSWAVGVSFTVVDCAALPALFVGWIVQPFAPEQQQLAAYLDRLLLELPSVRRASGEAQRCCFSMLPYRDAMPQRYLEIGL